MTRPGYNRRPSLPCADSVALMSATPGVLRMIYWRSALGDIATLEECKDLRPSARRLMLYPWYFGGSV